MNYSTRYNRFEPKNPSMTTKLLVPFIVAIVAISGILLNTGSIGVSPQANTLSESPLFLGHIELVAKDASGNIKAYRQTDNLVVNQGKMCAAINIFGVPNNSTQNTACGGVTTNHFTYVAVGTSTASPTATDTSLGAQVGSRATGTNGTTNNYSFINSTASSPTYSIQQQFRPNANIAEAGIFDAATGGHMFAHQQFTAITLGSTDTLTVTWRISLS